MIYIDFDGVILDTEDLLFKEWRKNKDRHLLSEKEKIKYIQNSNWKYIINNSETINDSIYYLNQMDPNNSFILTKIHSYCNEGLAKLEWAKRNNIKQKIILVPYYKNKCDIVSAKDNILIDDCLKNLDEWVLNDGIPAFFDINDDNIDSWDKPNINGYQKVLSLSSFVNK